MENDKSKRRPFWFGKILNTVPTSCGLPFSFDLFIKKPEQNWWFTVLLLLYLEWEFRCFVSVSISIKLPLLTVSDMWKYFLYFQFSIRRSVCCVQVMRSTMGEFRSHDEYLDQWLAKMPPTVPRYGSPSFSSFFLVVSEPEDKVKKTFKRTVVKILSDCRNNTWYF